MIYVLIFFHHDNIGEVNQFNLYRVDIFVKICFEIVHLFFRWCLVITAIKMILLIMEHDIIRLQVYLQEISFKKQANSIYNLFHDFPGVFRFKAIRILRNNFSQVATIVEGLYEPQVVVCPYEFFKILHVFAVFHAT